MFSSYSWFPFFFLIGFLFPAFYFFCLSKFAHFEFLTLQFYKMAFDLEHFLIQFGVISKIYMFVRFNSGFLAPNLLHTFTKHIHRGFITKLCSAIPFYLRSQLVSEHSSARARNNDGFKVFALKIQFRIQFIFSFSRINKIYLNSSLYEVFHFGG